ncbi:MarR family transcriptional regulator [Catellatospora methionotrophica]|uniref:MarR family transcriptional regulator n=1 Tax=Catellatospora methionotrophica TaxID=121620 RepID=A0A8J3LMN0_9ACTN|nr:MarR family transcriptional regulator [Catellatospora methionotrophica]GIG18111.1 MarR family transcriptional regulator [Catellatospora methionotrophica]
MSEPTRLAGLHSWLLTQTAAQASRLVNEGFASADARGYHFRVLATLDEHGPASQAALGRRSGIHLSDLVAAINELADRGFVERSPDPGDRRRNIVTVTAAGREQLARLDRQLADVQERLLVPLTGPERAELATLLGKLLGYHRMSS